MEFYRFIHSSYETISLKGESHEIFDFRFFMNQFPQAPEYPNRAVLNFFEISEIFAAQGVPVPPVSLTPAANGKNLQSEKF